MEVKMVKQENGDWKMTASESTLIPKCLPPKYFVWGPIRYEVEDEFEELRPLLDMAEDLEKRKRKK